MNVEAYLARRKELEAHQPRRREICTTCLQPDFGCYCNEVKRFDPKMSFVILHHPIEKRRRVATGRMAHLCMERSHLFVGHDYTDHAQIDEILADPNRHCVMLYPGKDSVDLSARQPEERSSFCPPDRELTIFVIDGTWATARQTVRSLNLLSMPRICFTPSKPSNFRIRKQPAPGCYSTIEAIHETIELLGEARGFPVESKTHDGLLHLFEHMVDKRLSMMTVKQRRTRAVKKDTP